MKNDWIIANINNPDFTTADFKNIGGFNLENTELLPIDTYLKSNKIISNPLFFNEQGEFSKDKFTDYYNKQAENFGKFQEDSSLDNYEYGFWDVFQKPSSRVRNPEFTIDKIANPTHQSTGVVGINIQGNRTKSDFELAEKQKIFDWSNGKFTDESPEDSALFSNPFKFISNLISEPLVLAKYEEDTDEIDPLTGQMVHHVKGENKTNSEGEYYFETLGGRSLIGKDVLSVGDILTKEDSSVNKYDFFDSDDLEKSPEGVIAKNLAAIAPMLFLGPIGASIYSGFYVGREILKTLPMLERVGTILSSDDSESSLLNNLAAYGQKFTGGTSEYAKNKTFAFENFGNLISDVALQWGQQKVIAETLTKLSTSNKNMLQIAEGKALSTYEKQAANIMNRAYAGELDIKQASNLSGITKLDDINNVVSSGAWKNTVVGNKAIEQAMLTVRDSYAKKQKLGQDLSLLYMSMISNTDVYDSAIEHGATKQEAALVALGSMIGMFSVDKYAHLGEMFFDDEKMAQRRLYRQLLKNHYDKDVAPVISSLASKTESETPKGLMQFFKTGKEKTIQFLKDYENDAKYHSLGILGKSIGEGIEEVAEEFVTDISKSLYELAGKFGYASQTDIGSWDNMSDRYLMSLFGGAIGGGLFGSIEAIKNPKSVSDKNSRDVLLTLVRQGESDKIIEELERMKNEGKLGSKDLSVKTQETESGEKFFLKADKDNISQNDFNYNQMKSAIQQMDKIINGNQLNLTDDQLFERMITSDMKLYQLNDYLKDASYISGYYQDFQNLVSDIYTNEQNIIELNNNTTDPEKRNSSEFQEQMQKLLDKREELNQRKEDFFNNKTQRYLQKTIFAINTDVSGMFLPVTFEQYVHKEYKKPVQFLSDSEKVNAKKKYDEWTKTKKVQELDQAFDSFQEMSKKIMPVLQAYSQSDIESWEKLRKELAENFPDFAAPNYDQRVEVRNVNIDERLKTLKVLKGEEYDKPWRSDPTKSNKAYQLQLEEDPSLYFEIVKDHEDGYWSIHFKTDNPDPNGPYSALTPDQKNRLFEAASLVIPEGDKLSTWGSLTKGGVSGLNRFGNFNYFVQNGQRKVTLKAGQKQVQINLDEDSIPNLEDLKNSKNLNVTLNVQRNKDGSFNPVTVYYSIDDNDNIGITLSNNDVFLISKDILPEENNFENYGKIIGISRKDGEWTTDVEFKSNEGITVKTFKSLLAPELVPTEVRNSEESYLTLGTTYNAEEEIQIPIWEKKTGESDEEYENRNTQLEDESDEAFQLRKQNREKQLKEQYTYNLIQSLQNLINSDAVVDGNTFRYIMANMGIRIKDIKNDFLKFIENGSSLQNDIQDITKGISDDLSNVDEIWQQIRGKIAEHVENRMSQQFEGLNKIKEYSDLSSSNGLITFSNLLNFLEKQADGSLVDLDTMETLPKDINDLILVKGNETHDILSALDLLNIKLYKEKLKRINQLKSLPTLSSSEQTELSGLNTELDSFKLYNTYELLLDDGSIITTKESENDLNILDKIVDTINLQYNEDHTIGYSESEYNKMFSDIESNLKGNFDKVIGQLSRDTFYTTLRDLQGKLQVKDSPILKLIKSIAAKLGEDYGSIEDTLQTIYEQYDGLADRSDFTLSQDQINALEKAKLLMDFTAASIISASETDSYENPWPYNKTINEWNREHRAQLDGEIEDLPEISKDLANISLGNLLQYKAEIDTWLNKARNNQVNKVKMFKEFDGKFEKVKLKFFMDNKDKWITEDGVNLLEGVQDKDNDKDQVLEYERVLYKNVQELLSQGKNISVIVDAFADSINWDQAKTQKISKLDLSLNDLTDYDKYIYLASIISLSPDNFYIEYKKFVEKNKDDIAPLSFQKHIIRILKAHENNKDQFNQLIDIFKQKTGLSDVAILPNTIIVTGIGGAGKSSVCGKSIINNNTWVCGPTETQVNNLKELGTNLKGFTTKELLKLILEDQYNDGINKDLVTFSDPKNDGGRANISRIKIKSFDNPPSNIVLDEATLVSNAELQVIAQWCKLNNVQLVLLGDENQNGNSQSGHNLARETTLSIRVPKMQLSLRDGNIWKYQNQQTLMNLEDSLRDTEGVEETTAVKNRLINTDLHKFGLKYYFNDGKLTGDMLTTVITDEQIAAIDGTVKFIGSISSPVYQKLKAAGKSVERAYSLEEIQGQEADYVVCDVNWQELGDFKNSAFKLLDFMRNLYTVITRSRKGSIIIDNGLSNIIKGNLPQSYSTNSVIIDKKAVKDFSDFELGWLNSLTLSPTADTPEVRGITPDVEIEPIIPDDEIITSETEIKAEINIGNTITNSNPIQVYTNFNYLGINRNSDGIWSNNSDSYRDVGIFLRTGNEVKENSDKRKYSDMLFDLKSYIIYDDSSLFNTTASALLKQHFSQTNLENIQYFVVKESYNPEIHHLISEEQGLEELPEGEEIYTLQARLKNKNGVDCIVTLGVLPKSTNLQEDITIEQLEKQISELEKTPGNESQISEIEDTIKSLRDGSFATNYQDNLDNVTEEGLEINKPDFTKICGLGRIRGRNSEGNTSYFKIRLNEVNSDLSRFGARTSNYVISPVYVSMDPSDPNAGKPCIFVSGRRIYRPSELADRYEELKQAGEPQSIRKIMLDSAGVSFESLFDARYADTFKTQSANKKNYTFPFDLLPTGVRMYTALHNFRANLRKLNKAITDKFGTDLIALEKILKEEARLYNQYRGDNEITSETNFRNWLESNQSEVQNGITFDQIKEIWDFNDNILKDVKQFRIGYNEDNGVYVRNISENYLGNYINPQVAKQYLGTIEKVFEVIIDKIIPPNSVNPNDLIDYRISQDMYEKLEKNWVEHIDNTGKLLINILESEEDGKSREIIPITIEHRDKIKALPLILTLTTKYLQARQRMSDPDALMEGYDDIDSDSPYKVRLGSETIPYLEILKGGLGDIRSGRDIEPGVRVPEEGQRNSDFRLINMFNIAFHGTVTTGGNDFTKSVSKLHAQDVVFPLGIFVDPILGGKYNQNSKYRVVSTNSKYYITGVAPSGAKTYINLSPKTTASIEIPSTRFKIGDEIDIYTSDGIYQGEDGEWTITNIKDNGRGKFLYHLTNKKGTRLSLSVDNVDSNTDKYRLRNSEVDDFHEQLNSIVGSEIDITGEVNDKEELINLANKKITKSLTDVYFTSSGRFNNIDELLNLVVSVNLDSDGNLVLNKIKDYEILKNVDNFVNVKNVGNEFELTTEDGKKYIISYSDGVKVKLVSDAPKNEFSWSISDLISFIDLDFYEDEHKDIIQSILRNSNIKYASFDKFSEAVNKFIDKVRDVNLDAADNLQQDIDNAQLLQKIENGELLCRHA